MRRAKVLDSRRRKRARLSFEARPGQLVAVREPDGRFVVMKILAADADTIHVRLYAERFAEQPRAEDLGELTLGSFGGGAPFSIGHMPLSPEGFAEDNPVLIGERGVTDDELEGYRIWLEEDFG